MPRKTFTAGEVLAAADVNSFLMDQSVMTFADSAARGSAIPTPSEGMLTYLDDTNALEVFDGAAFTAVGGGGSEAGLTHITTLSGTAVSSFSVNDVFSSDFLNYRVIISALTSGTTASMRLRMRASGADETGSNYFMAFRGIDTSGNNLTVTGNSQVSAAISRDTNSAGGPVQHFFYADFSRPHVAAKTKALGITYNSQSGDNLVGSFVHNLLNSFDGFTIFPSAGTITASIQIFGYKD